MVQYDDVNALRAYCQSPMCNESYANDWFHLGPLKMFKDGSLGGRTAMLREEYKDDPGNKGVEVVTDEYIQEMVNCAHENGVQVIIHAIGDDAIERVVSAYEKVNTDGSNPNRHGIVHCQITDTALLERIRKNNILIAYQPIFLHYDMHIVTSRCGDELTSTSYAFKTAKDMGIHASYGTDCPVEKLNPFPCIYAAVTRKDLTGFPAEGFYPQECVDVETAIDAYTIESAYHEFREDKKGRIKEGYYADLVVLNTDIFTCEPESIPNIKPCMTIVGGKIVYSE